MRNDTIQALQKKQPSGFFGSRNMLLTLLMLLTPLAVVGLQWATPITTARAQQPAPATGAGNSDLPALIVLVRHAERASEPPDDPPLTAAGVQRAQDLAAALRSTKFSAIITTQFLRTRDTAQPVGAALGLTPEIVAITELSSAALDAHVKAVEGAVSKHPGGAVLIVNHSNILPRIIATLGGPRLPEICDNVYDHLFMIVSTAGKGQFVTARYGAVSPPPGLGCI